MRSNCQKVEIVFHFSPKIEVVFHFAKNWSLLPFTKIWKLMSSSIYLKIEVVFHFAKKLRSSFIFPKNWGRLPFSKILRSYSISKNWGCLPIWVLLYSNKDLGALLLKSLLFWTAGRAAGRSGGRLEEMKIRLTQPSS